MVHIVRAPGVVSDADKAQAKALLESEFGDYERFRKSLPKEAPPTKPSKTIPVWTADSKQSIDLVHFLTETLQHLGYVPAGRNADEDHNEIGFRAAWSSPAVEHFVSFNAWGRPNQYLSASISLGHTPADLFADQARLNFLPAAYRDIYARQPIWQKHMSFELGRIASWGLRFSLDITEFSASSLARQIEDSIRTFAVEKLSSVKDVGSMFELGVRDEEPFRWPKWGDTPRVAMVAYLGRKLGRDADELRSTLIPYVAKFKSPPDTSEPSAEEFVDRVLRDADVALATG